MVQSIITLIMLVFLELVIERKFKIKRSIVKKINVVPFFVGAVIVNMIIQVLLFTFLPVAYNNVYIKGILMGFLLYGVINLKMDY